MVTMRRKGAEIKCVVPFKILLKGLVFLNYNFLMRSTACPAKLFIKELNWTFIILFQI